MSSDDTDRALEVSILDLLSRRAGGATICPSEAAKAVGGPDDEAWRALMEPARHAARRLVAAGEIEITQRGQVVDPSTAKGPIRLRKPASPLRSCQTWSATPNAGGSDRRVRPD